MQNQLTTVNFSMPQAEAEAILRILSNLPTGSNVYPLLIKLIGQYQEQVPQVEEAPQEQEAIVRQLPNTTLISE